MSYQALRLDGNGYASIADASQKGLDMGLSDFMIEAWVKTSYTAADQYIIFKYAANLGYFIYLRSSIGRLNFYVLDAGGNVSGTDDGVGVADGNWHHIAIAFDRSGNATRFVDGVATGTADNISARNGNIDNTSLVLLSSYIPPPSLPFIGQIDEVRIWNFGLNALPADYVTYIAWRAAVRNRFLATSEYDSDSWASYVTNNLKAHWKFDGDYTDETANGNDLTAGGTGNAFLGYTLKKNKIISPAWVR